MEENIDEQVKRMDDYDDAYWAEHFKVSVEEFRKAKNEVGDNLEEIAKYFNQ